MRNLITLLFLFVLANQCYALQIKSVVDNESVTANISAREFNRIFVNGDRIKSLQGKKGAYIREFDKEDGAILIKPVGNYQNTPINLFIKTEKGHNYTLLLVPVDVPSGTLMLEPKHPGIDAAKKWEQFNPYQKTLVNLIRAMINNEPPKTYKVEHKVGAYKKVKGLAAEISLVEVLEGAKLRGEIYHLKNLSAHPITYDESKFYSNNVRAVAFAEISVPAHGDTYLYRVLAND